MGLDPNKQWVGIWLTFFDIKKGPYNLPAPPNGTWYCPWTGWFGFGLTTDVWSMGYRIIDTGEHYGWAQFGSKLIYPDTWVFECIVEPGGPADLYRGENAITDPNEGYYGGYATIIPIYDTTMPKDISELLSDVRMNGPDQVFAEGMGAAGQKRAIRFARKADHSCCHFVLAPITNVF